MDALVREQGSRPLPDRPARVFPPLEPQHEGPIAKSLLAHFSREFTSLSTVLALALVSLLHSTPLHSTPPHRPS